MSKDDRHSARDEARNAAPGAADVRTQLERVLGSRCFSQATRSSRFLRYVTDETLAGRGERLKGYTIAVEVFDRAADFDAQTDPLVRVEAGRLRRRLAEYYAGEGRDDPLIIALPRGGYAVTCTHAPRAAAAEPSSASTHARSDLEDADDARDRSRSRRWRGAAVAACVALALVVLGRALFAPVSLPDAPASVDPLASGGSATIAVAAFDALDGGERSRTLGATLTEELLLELDEHELFAIAIEPSGSARYVLRGSIRSTPDQIRVTARLVVAATGEQLWTRSFDESPTIASLPAEQTRVARAIASVAAPYGPVFEAELARVTASERAELRTSDCVLEYYEYRSLPGPALHGQALGCFERASAVRPELANSWAGLALMLVDVFTFGYGAEQIGGAAALERAGEAARRAMDIDGESLLANLALARVQYFSDTGFQNAADRALVLCPNNIEALHLVGSLHVLSGDGKRGLAMVDRAIALAPDAPGSYYAAKALGHLREREYERAVEAALSMDAPDWHIGQIIVTATAGLAGRAELAERSRARLLELFPDIERQLPSVFERFRVAEDLREEVLRGLRAAGLQPAEVAALLPPARAR
jgi:adenylate cyclase